MPEPVLKAFILCEDIRENPALPDTMDLIGAGLMVLPWTPVPPLPTCKHSFWVYFQLSDDKPEGKAQLALRRADSGRAYFFREMIVEYQDPVTPTAMKVLVLDCEFPVREVYFVEWWYDDRWLADQRLELA